MYYKSFFFEIEDRGFVSLAMLAGMYALGLQVDIPLFEGCYSSCSEAGLKRSQYVGAFLHAQGKGRGIVITRPSDGPAEADPVNIEK